MTTISNATGNAADFRPSCGVYALIDPRTSRVMYVGQSVDIDYRYRQHMNEKSYRGNREKAKWIEELRGLGLVPRLVVLAECHWPASDDVERDFIRSYKSDCQCELNAAPGGINVRRASKLSNSHKDDWFQLGLKIKAIQEAIMDASADAQRLGGKKTGSLFFALISGLVRAKAHLEGCLRREYPEWEDVRKVFFGNIDNVDIRDGE